MTHHRSRPPDLPALVAGAASGVAASIVQAAVGESEDALLLPPRENSHYAPRLMARVAGRANATLTVAERWTLGTGFHLGYGAFWGTLYSVARERSGVHPLLGGALLGGFIYAITFPRWGGAIKIQAERPPGVRTRRMTFVAASVTVVFGLTTALLYERLRPRRR